MKNMVDLGIMCHHARLGGFKRVIQNRTGPSANGPTHKGVAYTGETIVVSGQLPIVPETGSSQEVISLAKRINH